MAAHHFRTTHTKDVDDALELASRSVYEQQGPGISGYVALQLGKAIVFALLLIVQAIDNK